MVKSKVSTRDLVLHVLLEFPESPIKTIKKVLKKDWKRDISRTRIEQLLADFKRQNTVFKEKGVKDRRLVLCSINPDKIDTGFFTVIKDSEKALVYDEDAGIMYNTRFLYKIKHDLSDELDEFYDNLQKIRDEYFKRNPLAIETDKVRGFDDWGPDSQKLVEGLEKALSTGLERYNSGQNTY